MRQDYFTFRRSFKTVLVTNEKPTIRESRLAVWRRIRLLPFSISIPAERQDKRLTQKLRAEWPGILAWFVQGCLRWQEKGLDTPARVTTATEEYRSEEDVLGPFFDEVCEANEAATVSRPAIWRAYTEWAKENSERFTLNREGLYQRLRQRGAEDCYFKEHGRTRRGFRGVGIATQLTHPDTPFSG